MTMLKVGSRGVGVIKSIATGLVLSLAMPQFMGGTASAGPVYGPATPVAELNTSALDRVSYVSFDGLTLVLFRQQSSITQSDLFISTRASTSDPRSTPSSAIFADANS